ncbi:MAG: insulinase family protein, partial [Planctomycetota bacterium]|nr:insulinase family protein [Planctomycetota bacterium]
SPTTGPAISPAYEQAIEMAKLAILEEVHRIRRDGVSEADLARAKRLVLAGIVTEGQTAMALANRAAADTIGMGDPDHLQRYAKRVRAVTAEEVGAAAAKYLDDSRQMTMTLLPAPAGGKAPPLTRPADVKPAKPSPREAVELDNIVLIEKIRATLDAQGGDVRPMEIGPIKLVKLPNGLRLLLQRSTVVPAVSIQYFQLGGLLADEPGREGVGNAVASMLLKGAGNRNAEQISDEIESLGASLDFQCGNNSSFGQATCLTEDWDRILSLMADVILDPKFPAEEWEKLRPRMVQAIGRQTDSWSGELREKFRAAYFPGHVWSTSPLGRADVVGGLKTEQMREFHQAHLGASNSVLAVFGDIDPEAVAQRAGKLFEALPAKPLISAMPMDPPPQKVARVLQFKTNKSLAAAQIGMGPGVTRQHPDYPAVRVLEEVLGRFPSGMLAEALRGRGPGLVYAVGAGSTSGIVAGCFNVTFNTQPHQVAEAVRRALEVIAKAKAEPMDEATVDDAKASVLREEFAGRQSNGGRAMQAALAEIYGLGQDETTRFVQSVTELTPAALQAVAQLYLVNPVVVVISHQPAPQETLDAALKPAPEAPAGGKTRTPR